VPDVLVQLADPVRDAVMEVSVPFAGLNCATDVPANSLLPENDNVAAGLIVIVKFSVMVPALAAGANIIAAATASAAPSFDFIANPSERNHRSRHQHLSLRVPLSICRRVSFFGQPMLMAQKNVLAKNCIAYDFDPTHLGIASLNIQWPDLIERVAGSGQYPIFRSVSSEGSSVRSDNIHSKPAPSVA
jgi:hypothetical protein